MPDLLDFISDDIESPSYCKEEFWTELKRRVSNYIKSENYYDQLKGYVFGLMKINPNGKVSIELQKLYEEVKCIHEGKMKKEESPLLKLLENISC